MSASESSTQCPHCKTFLPAEVSVCSACGGQLAAPDAGTAPSNVSPSEFIPYDGPENPETWPLDQPYAIPQSQSYPYPYPTQATYPPPPQAAWATTQPAIYPPQGQPGPARYYTPLPAAAPVRRTRMLLLIALALLVVLGGAVGGIFLALHAASTPRATLDRHGLQGNVPLPDNIAFQYKHTVTQGNLTADEWIWKVSKGEPASIQQFYRDHLPTNGWTHVQPLEGTDTLGVVGCQGSQVLVVGISKHLQDNNGQGTPTTTDAPTGGSALGIALTDNQALKQNFCETLQP